MSDTNPDANLISGTTDAEEAFGTDDISKAVAAAEAHAGEEGIDWSDSLGTSEDEGEDDEVVEASGEVGGEPASAAASVKAPDAPEASPGEEGEEGEGTKEEIEKPPKQVATAWVQITEAEKRNRQERDTIRAERHDLELKQKTFQEAYQEATNRDALLRQNPVAALEQAGVDINAMLEGIVTGKASPVHQQNHAQSALEQRVQQLEAEKAQAQGNTIVTNWRNNAQATINQDKYALLQSHPDAVGELEDLAVKYHQQYGEVLEIPAGADMLLEVRQEELRNTYSNPAVRKALGLPDDSDPDGDEETPANQSDPAKSAPRTVTKNMRAATKKPKKTPGRSGPFDSDGGVDRALAEIEKRGGIQWDDEG